MNEKENGLRERLDMEYQMNEQLRAYRYATNIGDLKAMGRTLYVLKGMLWSEFPKDSQENYNRLIYKPREKKDLYSIEDRENMRDFGELSRRRMKELEMLIARLNRKLFYNVCDDKLNLILETAKRLGLTWEKTDDAFLSHDKKKPISWAGRYNKGFTKTSLLRNATGSAR